jgi:hypothetical protein
MRRLANQKESQRVPIDVSASHVTAHRLANRGDKPEIVDLG